MANICNNGLIYYWAGTATFRKKYRSFLSIYIDLILCIMILYKNYIRILGSYVFIFIHECGCNYRVNVLYYKRYHWLGVFNRPYQKYVIRKLGNFGNYIWR